MIFSKPPDHLIKVATLIKDFWKLWETVVWSSRSFREIHVKHDTPAGKPCKKTKWHVPEQKARDKRWSKWLLLLLLYV